MPFCTAICGILYLGSRPLKTLDLRKYCLKYSDFSLILNCKRYSNSCWHWTLTCHFAEIFRSWIDFIIDRFYIILKYWGSYFRLFLLVRSISLNAVQRYGFFWNSQNFSDFFFKQKTAYEIASGDWSSDVCSSDLSN